MPEKKPDSREKSMKQTISVWVDDKEKQMAAVWAICPVCHGEGKSSAHLGSFAVCDWVEKSEEFKKDYQAGVFDRKCERCSGTGKVLKPDPVYAGRPLLRA